MRRGFPVWGLGWFSFMPFGRSFFPVANSPQAQHFRRPLNLGDGVEAGAPSPQPPVGWLGLWGG